MLTDSKITESLKKNLATQEEKLTVNLALKSLASIRSIHQIFITIIRVQTSYKKQPIYRVLG